MLRLIIALLCLSPLSLAAAQSSNCDRPKNDFDGLYCLNKVYQESDDELNAAFGKLNRSLNAEGKAMLKRGQLQWIRERNDKCSESRGNEFLVNLRCATEMTVERLQFLQARQRECASAGCRNSRFLRQCPPCAPSTSSGIVGSGRDRPTVAAVARRAVLRPSRWSCYRRPSSCPCWPSPPGRWRYWLSPPNCPT